MSWRSWALPLSMGLILASAAKAEIRVGATLSATGPGASLGVHYKNTYDMLPKTLGGEPVTWIVLDDGSDPTNAVRNARKLVTEEKVDVLVGGTITPTTLALTAIAAESDTPQLAMAPIDIPQDKYKWVFVVPQSVPMMVEGVVEHMKKNNIKTIAYIGFADAWGDVVEKSLAAAAEKAGINIVARERYARADTSVLPQVLRVMGARPDAVMLGGAGTPGALPHLTLRERGYRGPIYDNHGVVNPDFIRVGGPSVEGAIAPTGPLVVGEQLSATHPVKKVGQDFMTAYMQRYGAQNRNAFAGYAWDAHLLLDRAAGEALKKAKPGTPEFRAALRDALERVDGVGGTHAIYKITPDNHYAANQHGRVLVTVKEGSWKLLQE